MWEPGERDGPVIQEIAGATAQLAQADAFAKMNSSALLLTVSGAGDG